MVVRRKPLVDARTPVLVGVGQVTNKRHRLIDPMTLMEDAARLANDDAGGRTLERVQSVQVVNSLSGRFSAPATALGRHLGLPDGERLTTQVGGSTPQWLINEASQRVSNGELEAVLIAGAEAVDSMRRARREGTSIHGRDAKDAPPDTVIGDDRVPMSPQELSAQVIVPIQIYPMFEQAIAAEKGRSLDDQRTLLGEIMAPFTKVAASYPDLAWFPDVRTPAELSTVSEGNRMIAEPYPKNLNAIMQVDMGAAVILMSAEAAEAAGAPSDKWVFPWAGAKCDDSLWAAQRLEYARSPALETAARAALDAAGIGVDDIALFDLYSCFPCSVEMSADAVGVTVDDPRGLTVTGGLPFFGGPGNNYVSHAVATMAQRLREQPDAIGYVSGVSYYMSKHSVGIYSATPPPNRWVYADTKAEQTRLDAQIPEIAAEADDVAVVDAFTVEWDREGPVRAPAYATLPDGRRVVATPADAATPKALSGRSLVGEKVRVRNGEGGVVYELI